MFPFSSSVALAGRRAWGFTLIEMMIVVAIISILGAIAYPTYLEHVRKSRRVDAKTALLDLASRQERYFSTRNVYATTPDKLGYSEAEFPSKVFSGKEAYYQLSVTASSPFTTYSASATPLGTQTKDKCHTYTITSLGVQGNSGVDPVPEDCW